VEWCRRHYATRLHPDGEYDVWRVEIDLAADEPFLPVHLVRFGREVRYDRPWRSAARPTLTVEVRIDPMSWPESDDVCLASGPVVRSEALKRDPRPFTELRVETGATLSTGAVWSLVEFPRFDVAVDLGLVAKADTEAVHSRWRLRERHLATLREPYAFPNY
jgi:hypothetical protein